MDKGAPSTVDVKSQDVFNPLMKTRLPVPYPLGRFLKFYKNSLELGDSAWDPDFPSSAATSGALYRSATGQVVDGTLSIDPYALADLLGVTGPIDLPGYGTFNSENFFSKLNFIVNASTSPGSGKGALGTDLAGSPAPGAQPAGGTLAPAVLGDQGAGRGQAHPGFLPRSTPRRCRGNGAL